MSSHIVISDLDGTIALIDHRRHWVEYGKHLELSYDERWRRFFAECVNDLPNLPVILALKALASSGYRIDIVSARSDEVRKETEEWLKKHGVIYDTLRMRSFGDHTPDHELKEIWLLTEYNLDDILVVFDDRDSVVRLWRSKGLTCFQVAEGNF